MAFTREGLVLAGEVPADHVVGDGKEASVRAFGTPDRAFVAQAPAPLVGTGRRVAGLAARATFETAWVDVVAPSEE